MKIYIVKYHNHGEWDTNVNIFTSFDEAYDDFDEEWLYINGDIFDSCVKKAKIV